MIEETKIEPVASKAKPAPAVETPEPVETKVEPAAPAVTEAKPEAPTAAAAEKPEPAAEEKPAAKPTEDWRDARIRQLSAKLAEERKKKVAVPEAAPRAAPDEATLDNAEVERRAEIKARAQVQLDAFNKACGEAAAAGKAQFPDFDQRLSGLLQLVDQTDPASASAYNEFLVAALETGKAPEIIHALGGDLNEAARVLALPPIKRAVELTRLAEREPAAPPELPKPIKAIGSNKGAAATQIDPADASRADNLSTAEWMRRRNEQIKSRNAAR